MTTKVRVRWTGAAGIELVHQGRALLLDPYLSRPGKWECFFGRPRARADAIDRYLKELKEPKELKELPAEVAAVAVGHTHLDHALDIPELSRRYEGALLGSSSLDTLLRMHGLEGRVRVCRGGDRVDIEPGISVTMIPSRHGLVFFGRVPYPGEIDGSKMLPLKASDYRLGDMFMISVEIGGTVFLQVGSANFIPEQIEGRRCDVLLLCVPGWRKIPGYPERLIDMVQPKMVIPFHYDDFSAPMPADMRAPSLPGQGVKAFLQRIAGRVPGLEVRVPATYEALEI
jgi:L-ascorbate metabolism protein UlaG (beta-lactamase superfamily)